LELSIVKNDYRIKNKLLIAENKNEEKSKKALILKFNKYFQQENHIKNTYY